MYLVFCKHVNTYMYNTHSIFTGLIYGLSSAIHKENMTADSLFSMFSTASNRVFPPVFVAMGTVSCFSKQSVTLFLTQ